MALPEKYPTDASGMLDLASVLVERLLRSQSTEDLFSAVLAVVHAVEWDAEWKKARKNKKFECDHKEWNLLRELGNGMKHATKRTSPLKSDVKSVPLITSDLEIRPLEWEDLDFWENAGNDEAVWFVKAADGTDRSVASYCLEAIRGFQDELAARVV